MRVFIQKGAVEMAIPRWKHGPAEDIPVESYQTAISKASAIDVAPAGTLISRTTSKRKTATKKADPVNPLLEIGKLIFPPLGFALHPGTQEIIEEPELLGFIFPPAAFIGDAPPGWDTATKMKSGIDLGTDITALKEDPSYPDYYKIPDIKFPEIKFPEFPDLFGGITDFLDDLGKNALLVGAAVIGGYLLLKKK